jgi:hypothetical protein
VGVVQKVPEEMPVVGVDHAFGHFGKVEEEEVPGLAELARVVQPLGQLAGMGRVEDGEASTTSGWCIAVAQATVPPQS